MANQTIALEVKPRGEQRIQSLLPLSNSSNVYLDLNQGTDSLISPVFLSAGQVNPYQNFPELSQLALKRVLRRYIPRFPAELASQLLDSESLRAVMAASSRTMLALLFQAPELETRVLYMSKTWVRWLPLMHSQRQEKQLLIPWEWEQGHKQDGVQFSSSNTLDRSLFTHQSSMYSGRTYTEALSHCLLHLTCKC